MSDVDAVRLLASEYNLEFVDLDRYNVDRSTSSVIPESLARKHRVVPIGRKFGAPVIAISNPADIVALDTLRATIGREFISVVALGEQIDACLERVYGANAPAPPTLAPRRASVAAPVPDSGDIADLLAPDLPAQDAVHDDSPLSVALEDALGFAASAPSSSGLLANTSASVPAPASSNDVAAPVGVAPPPASTVAPAAETIAPTAETADAPVDAVAVEAEPEAPSAEPDRDAPPDVSEPALDEIAVQTSPGDDGTGSQIADVGAGGDGGANDAGDETAFAEESEAAYESADAAPQEALGEADAGAGDDHPSTQDVVEPGPTERADETGVEDAGVAESAEDALVEEALGISEPSEEADPGEAIGSGEAADLRAAASADPGEPASAGAEPTGASFESYALAADAALADAASSTPGQVPTSPFGAPLIGDPEQALGEALAVFPEAVDVVDDVSAAADLVEEAVAEFENSAGDIAPVESDGELAGFPPLARVLVEGGRVSLEAMRGSLEEHNQTGQSIARVLTSHGLVTEADLMWGMAQEMGLDFVDLDVHGLDFAAAFDLPEATARHHNVLVIGRENGVPIVAASNPTDVFAMDDLRTIIGRNFVTVVATRTQINNNIDKAYNNGGDASAVANTAAGDFGIDEAGEDLENIQAVVDDAPIVRYVNLLILQALNERASDIHVEPNAEQLRIRYRIDGVLHDMSTAPRSIAGAVTTRLKVMADMNIAEHRVPQDGRISLNVGNRSIDLRMATLPTIYGEKIVMRVLDKSNVVLGFEDLGFDSDLLSTYEDIYGKPYGTILVTGPTGSGKTTTLYATLSALNNPEKNIITVEDPVELRIKGINQVQLNTKAGLTFASALKSILRSDPDIVLVGEIRDKETALISVEASLTGHLVLATLHTNDAASTPMRLVEMGLEPYLVTSAMSSAVAQRLARRLCQHCKEPYEPTEADVVAAGWRPEEVFTEGASPKVHRAVGCSACSNTGYRGRKALIELLVVTEEVERMIIEGGTSDDIHRLAVEQGMVPLRQAGLRKALEGETTLEEVLRVVA